MQRLRNKYGGEIRLEWATKPVASSWEDDESCHISADARVPWGDWLTVQFICLLFSLLFISSYMADLKFKILPKFCRYGVYIQQNSKNHACES